MPYVLLWVVHLLVMILLKEPLFIVMYLAVAVITTILLSVGLAQGEVANLREENEIRRKKREEEYMKVEGVFVYPYIKDDKKD